VIKLEIGVCRKGMFYSVKTPPPHIYVSAIQEFTPSVTIFLEYPFNITDYEELS